MKFELKPGTQPEPKTTEEVTKEMQDIRIAQIIEAMPGRYNIPQFRSKTKLLRFRSYAEMRANRNPTYKYWM